MLPWRDCFCLLVRSKYRSVPTAGRTSDAIVTEVPVEETCDSTGYRLYRKYLAAIGENPSYFQWKDFPKYLGAAYVDEKGHFVIQVLGDSAKARKQIVEVVGSDEVTVNSPEKFSAVIRFVVCLFV